MPFSIIIPAKRIVSPLTERKRKRPESVTIPVYNAFAEAGESAPFRSLTVREILRRANITKKIYNSYFDTFSEFAPDVVEQIFTEVKYEGYLARAEKARADQKKLENSPLPQDIDYMTVSGLRLEAREKLNKIHPVSIGQASRISGVTPADINVLIMALNLK